MKLSAAHRSDLPEDLLRDFATAQLGAVRCSASYLSALRHVLGNLAAADRTGDLLELNTAAPFTTRRTMRTILAQMEAAGLTFRLVRNTGAGRQQSVACYRGTRPPKEPPALTLERMLRQQEDEDDKRRAASLYSWSGNLEDREARAGRLRLAALGLSASCIPH